jgi:hypothetical protein
MPTIEQNQQALSSLLDVLKWFKEADAEKLKRSDLGPLSFDAFSDTVARTLGLYRSLLDCDLSNVSYAKLSEITSAGNAAKTILENIRLFEVTQQNPAGERQSIIQRLVDQWEFDFAAVTPVLAYATKSSADFQRLEREARGALIDLNGSKITFQEQTSGIIGQMNSALGQVQDAAKKAGVSIVKRNIPIQLLAKELCNCAYVSNLAVATDGKFDEKATLQRCLNLVRPDFAALPWIFRPKLTNNRIHFELVDGRRTVRTVLKTNLLKSYTAVAALKEESGTCEIVKVPRQTLIP